MKKITMLAMALCLLATISSAQESSYPNYVGFTMGGVFPMDFESENKTPNSTTGLDDLDVDNGYIFGVKFGHIFEETNNILALELEGFMIDGTDIESQKYYTHSGAGNPDVNMTADLSTTALMFNALARYPKGDVHPYAGVGLGWAWTNLDNTKLILPSGWFWTQTGTRNYSMGDADDDCFAWQFLLGADYDLTDSVVLGLGYRYFHTEPSFSKDEIDIDTKFRSHMITAGLSLKF